MYIDRRPGKQTTPLAYRLIFIAGGFIVAFLMIRSIFIPVRISEQAMSPALQKGDIVVFMRFIPPRTGDIVLYIDPLQHDTKGVRRVTAEPGSTVRITDKTVFVNSKTSEQPFQMRDDRIFPASFSSRDNLEPLTVPDGHYFLMGDNFDRSSDSRRYGSVPRDSIVGVLILSI